MKINRAINHSGPVRKVFLMVPVSLMAFLVIGCGQSGVTDPPAVSASPAPIQAVAAEVPLGVATREAPASRPPRERSSAPSDEAPTKRVRPRSRIRAGGVLDLVFDDLEFEIEPDDDFERGMLTEEIEELHDKSVIIRGFILDSSIFQQKGIKKFVLVRDNQICCFGPGAKIHHNIQVDMDEGKTANFTFRPVEIRGTLKIQPWILPADGKCYSVYHVQAASVKPTQ